MMVLGRNSGVSHVVSGGGARGTAPQRVTRARAGMVRGGDLKLRASFTTTTVPAASAYCYHTTGNIASTLQLYPRRAGLFEPTRIPVQAVFQYRTWERRAFSFSTSKTPAMASATSFYDFKPKDSTYFSSAPSPFSLSRTHIKLTFHPRERLRLRPLQAQRQGRPRRQHGLKMRLHTTIRGPREALQRSQSRTP